MNTDVLYTVTIHSFRGPVGDERGTTVKYMFTSMTAALACVERRALYESATISASLEREPFFPAKHAVNMNNLLRSALKAV